MSDCEFDEQWFAEYRKLGGKHTKKVFLTNLDVFFDLTVDVFVGGDNPKFSSREDAMATWAKYLKCSKEAEIYFHAVDNVMAYT
jgi:hypothetical protein